MTDAGRGARPPVVARAEAALRALGTPVAAFARRDVEGGSWFADWSGDISGSDVYIGLMGGSPAASSVRLLLDDWVFDDVAGGDVGELLLGIFSGQATITRQRSFPFSSIVVLEHAVGGVRYSATRRLGSDEEPQPWERPLIAE
ncbi:hypothetical protein SAMN05216481_11626 [Streptomyces radiopugnans]|uniref:Uncharacterized protein n=1 Tax=Streptomyces radiopugnans TaxID=403935 RepID=A0A1H9J2E7_9ACTN|nr:hypothetical protein SAMN05216481_11626 [Streptomyces radiopugnans]